MIQIGSDKLSVLVKKRGAELASLQDAAGREFLWQAGPEWPRHSPLLFPIIGRLRQDTAWIGDTPYPMDQHGFARDHDFTAMELEAASCRLLLTENEATLARYPFAFRLEVIHAVHGTSYTNTTIVTNTGEGVLPCSVGAHPAFRWPLPEGGTKPAHRLDFEQDEPEPCYRPRKEDGLLDPTPGLLPLSGRSLGLREELFEEGALVLLNTASRRVTYASAGGPVLEMAWQGYEQLGIWMKPGADFLCIEPWAGYADVAGQETDFWNKPGIMLLGPGESRRFTWRVTLA